MSEPSVSDARREVAAAMASAAAVFLASLDDDQCELAGWPFPSDDERRRWFYTPTDHGGVPLGDLSPAQQRLALRLVATGLSRAGYVTVSTILGLENVLDHLEGWVTQFDRERGRDPGRYYLRVFGDPGADRAWSWRFGGHHVSINHTVVDGEVAAVTPCFLGADPAASPLLGPHPLRPLAGAEDLGRELVRSLDEAQRAAAILSPVAPVDIVGANRSRVAEGDLPLPLPDVWRGRFDGEPGRLLEEVQRRAEQTAGLRPEHLEAVRLSTTPRGIAADRLTADQQQVLRALLDAYVGRIPEALADAEAAKYDGDRIGGLAFAWAGGVEPGEGHYYRIQGPDLLVEYDNTQRGANHIHTVWRDPDRDFGGDPLGSHLRTAH
ncbi:MAG TPA: DUF3500 domain-containing protein [Acidimicrobiales bacterium]|nr:DUF3500 domain-containing protein [Acidimicrobiales bacterium]